MRARSRMHVASIDNTQRPPETSDSFSFSPPPVSLLKTTFFLTALNTATRVSHGDALGDKRRVRRAESGRVSVPLPASSNVTSSLTRGCRLRPIVLADTLQRAITTGMQLRPPSSVPPSYFQAARLNCFPICEEACVVQKMKWSKRRPKHLRFRPSTMRIGEETPHHPK